MITPKGISKHLPRIPSLRFSELRKEGLTSIQELSGEIWTDFNLHDPGVTTLEVLCYAITELGYRADLLKEALEADGEVAPDFASRYFFSRDELIPPLPLTRVDFEHFIEEQHPGVAGAWLNEFPLYQKGPVRGGYEIAVMLEPDAAYGYLNTDAIPLAAGTDGAGLEIILFDEDNQRLPWKDIKKITGCEWDEDAPDSFFVFEQWNCQLALTLEAVYRNHSKTERRKAVARVTLQPSKKLPEGRQSVEAYREWIIQQINSPAFLSALAHHLAKEHHKERILAEVHQSLLACRNLCEDFISLRIVNGQEVKIEAEIVLDSQAPAATFVMNAVYDQLDAFLQLLLRRDKQAETPEEQHILYASNLIEEMVKMPGIEAVHITGLNLFVDGIPTISLKDETAFECIHLQQFSRYVPKISREKSNLVFIRSGSRETVSWDPDAAVAGTRRMAGPATQPAVAGRAGKTLTSLDEGFFENLRQYHSIRNDFPQNYRLREGQLNEKAPELWKVRTRQFKTYLAFFERLIIDYLERLYHFNELLSLKQSPGIAENGTGKLARELQHLDWLTAPVAAQQEEEEQFIRKNKILDHLLARFATAFIPLTAGETDPGRLENTVKSKTRLLNDIPLVTRERGLGIPIAAREKPAGIWDSPLLSGFQKRIYRLLGMTNENLHHIRLSKVKHAEPAGFYLVEHILLVKRRETRTTDKKFNAAARLLDEYLQTLSTRKQRADPYSFQLTLIVPDWHETWHKQRNQVESIIQAELPAHILPSFCWLSKKEMAAFESLYEPWFTALLELNS